MVDPYTIALILHIVGASIWIGGHIIIFAGYMVPMLRSRDFSELDRFESIYERIGIPSLLISVATGVYMGSVWYPIAEWFNPGSRAFMLGLKVLMLLATLGLAADARLRIIRRYRFGGDIDIYDLAIHISIVTILAIGFGVAGVMFRYG